MSDQWNQNQPSQSQQAGMQPGELQRQAGPWQQPLQRNERMQQQQERNAIAQNTGGAGEGVDMEQVAGMIKAEYANVAQPGLDPANRPSGEVAGERNPHKSTRDLEDITGNPGHRGVNPNAPAISVNPMPSALEGYPSINEPPGSNVLPPLEIGEGENQRLERQSQQGGQPGQQEQPQLTDQPGQQGQPPWQGPYPQQPQQPQQNVFSEPPPVRPY